MNILHHKSWHVRNKDNIAKVRRDEAEAAEKEQAEIKRAKLAEQEARLRFLRNRSRTSSAQVSAAESIKDKLENESNLNKISVDIFTSEGNINFFKDVEAGIKVGGVNKEHEEETKKEREDYEKKIGLLTYLGQDTLESTGGKEWYSQSSKSLTHFKDGKTNDDDSNEEVHYKYKSRCDPLSKFIKNLLPIGSAKFNSLDSLTPKAITKYCRKLKEKKKKLKRNKHKSKKKKEKKYKKRDKKSIPSQSDCSKYSKIKRSQKFDTAESFSSEVSSNEESDHKLKNEKLRKLREERLKRETVEKKRAERLLNGRDPDLEEPVKVVLPYTQKYSSQFNPHIARQNEWLNKPLEEMYEDSKR